MSNSHPPSLQLIPLSLRLDLVLWAESVLKTASPESLDNTFGSIGELKFNLMMCDKWERDENFRRLISSLDRISHQTGHDVKPFIWDENLLTHVVDLVEVKRILALNPQFKAGV